MSNILGKVFGVALIASGAVLLHDLSLHKTPELMSIPIPEECGETFNCQSSWLSKVLGFNIDSFTLRNLGGGFTSQSYRLAFTAPSEPTEKSNSLPNSAVVKYSNPEDMNWFMRFMFWLMGGVEPFARNEIYFYKHMRERLSEIGLRTPKVYYTGMEDHGRRNVLLNLMGFSSHFRALLVMEDLCEHKVFGLMNSIPSDYAFVAARNLANLHAAFWDDKIKALAMHELKEPLGLYLIFFNINRFTRYPQTKEEVRTRFKNWAQCDPIFQDLKIQTLLETFVEVYPKLLKYATNNKSTSGPLFRHHTFLHGDYHSGNLFFVTDPIKKEDQTPEVKEVITIDWQGYGMGHSATELAYFLSFCEPSMELDLSIMQSYYEELTKTVPKETYPFQVMVREVEIRMLGIGVSGFNGFRDTPETLKNRSHLFSRNGIESDVIMKHGILRMKRMAYILEKWEKENLIHNLNELENVH
jgi:hypothetical protein